MHIVHPGVLVGISWMIIEKSGDNNITDLENPLESFACITEFASSRY